MPDTDGFDWYFGIIEWDGATATEMDLSVWGEQVYALLTTGPQDQVEMPITFPSDTPLPFPIRVKREWVAGPRNALTREWNGSKRLYGGYLEQQEGDTEGTEHIIIVTLATHSFLPDTVDVLGWPGTVDADPVSYPPDFSVAAWLVGKAGDSDIGGSVRYDGLIPARLGGDGGVLLTGVDDVFYTIAIPATALPAPQGVIGAFGKTDLRECITDLLDLVRYLMPGMDPAAHFDTVVDPGDPTRLRPRFRLTDRAGITGGAVAHFSTNPVPDSGEWQIIRPSRHLLKAQGIRTRVVAMGETGDATLPGTPLAYYIATSADHLAAYPTRYHTDPGWSGKPYIDNRLDTVAKAEAAAVALEAVLWGSEDTITYYTTCDFIERGDLITITDEAEAYDHTFFTVADAAPEQRDGALLYKITIGLPEPNILEIIRDAARGVRRTRNTPRSTRSSGGQGDLSGAGFGSTGLPGTPRRVPTENRPYHPAQNTIAPMFDDTPALNLQGSAVGRPTDLPAGPLDPAPPPPPANLFNATAAGALLPGTYITAEDGRPHPQQYHLGGIAQVIASTDVTATLTYFLDAATVHRVLVAGTGTVTLLRNGTAITGTLADTSSDGSGTIYQFASGFRYEVLQRLGVAVAGASSTAPLWVVISE